MKRSLPAKSFAGSLAQLMKSVLPAGQLDDWIDDALSQAVGYLGGEKPLAVFIQQGFGFGTGRQILILTATHLLIQTPLPSGTQVAAHAWADFSGVTFQHSGSQCLMQILLKSGMSFEVDRLKKSDARVLQRLVQERLQEPKHPEDSTVVAAQPKNHGPNHDPMDVLASLRNMLYAGLITQADYDAKKAEVLRRL